MMDRRESILQLKRLTYYLQLERRETGNRALTPILKAGANVAFRVVDSHTLESGKTTLTMSVVRAGARLPNNYILRNISVALIPCTKGNDPYYEIFSGRISRLGLSRFEVEVDRFVTPPKVSKLRWKMLSDDAFNSSMFDTLQDMMCILITPPPPGMRIPRWPGAMELIPMILDPKAHARFFRSLNVTEIQFKNESLDAIQKEAVCHALSSRHIALISGPPGTGKTTVLVEIIHQLTVRDQRVLVCGNSNPTVDTIFNLLVANQARCLRLGNQKTCQNPRINESTMNYQLINGPNGPDIIHLRSVLHPQGRLRRFSPEKIHKIKLELSRLELGAFKDIVSGAHVVLSTLREAACKGLQNHCFDVAIIDEASAALDPESWLAISRANKIILSGDPCQLSPTFHSQYDYLEKTLFKRLMGLCPQLLISLNQQYRMNSDIMEFPSRYLYSQKVSTHSTAQHRLLAHLPNVEENDFTSQPLIFLNTSNCKLAEIPNSAPKWNPGEASLVAMHISKLVASGVKPDLIGVISPYEAQVEVLRAMIQPRFPKIEVDSVSAFQGREKEAIIVSLVRSNPLKRAGFLRDYRHLNVAMTRARCHLCIVGDGESLIDHSGDPPTRSYSNLNFLPALRMHLSRYADIWLPEMYL